MRILFSFGVVVVFLASLELMTRIYTSLSPVYDIEMSRYARDLKASDPDPELGFLHRKKQGGDYMGVRLDIDENGERRETARVMSPETRSIFFLGDSLTLGWGVSEKETFSRRLEEKLSETCGHLKIFNFGHGNYNLVRSVRLLKKVLLHMKPHGIFVYYFINDAENLSEASDPGILAHSEFVSLFWSRLKRMRSSGEPDFLEYYRGLYREGEPGWEKTKGAFEELAKIARSLNVPLGVIILPEFRKFEPYPFSPEHEKIARVAQKNGILISDITASFKDESPHSLWVAPDDSHPNAQGHALIAKHTQSFVQTTLGGCR